MGSYSPLNINIKQINSEDVINTSTSAPESLVNDVFQNGDAMFSGSMFDYPEYTDYKYFE